MTEMKPVSKDACPICEGPGERISLHIRGNKDCTVFHCWNCDAAFLARDWVRANALHFEERWDDTPINSPEALRELRVKTVAKHLKGDERLLEIAPGGGLFLDAIKDKVASAEGCAAEEVEALPEEPRYDVVCVFHHLAHIHLPHEFLKAVRRAMKPGGLLIAEVPNYRDPLFSLYRIPKFRTGHFFSDMHPVVYSPGALKALMRANGFEHVETTQKQTCSLTNHLGWIYMGRNEETRAEGMEVRLPEVTGDAWRPHWEKLDTQYRKMMEDAGMGDVMTGVFRLDAEG